MQRRSGSSAGYRLLHRAFGVLEWSVYPYILPTIQCTISPNNPFSSQPHQPPQPHPPPLPTIQLRPNIQIKTQPPAPPPIKINHILHPPPLTPLHHPIMPIKRRFIPPQRIPPRLRTHPLTIPAKTPQHRPITFFIFLCREPFFPVFDLEPGALVDGVVDGDDGGHVGGVGGVVFAFHGFEKHFFGGVDPVLRGGGGGGGWGGGREGCC